MRVERLVPALLVVLTAAALIFAIGTARAAELPRVLTGFVDPSGTVTLRISEGRPFEVRGPHPESLPARVYRFTMKDVPLTCNDGSVDTYDLRGRSKVPKDHGIGSFLGGGHGSLDTAGNRDEWTVLGLLEKPGYATGIVRAKTVDASGPEKVTCRSGRLAWSSSK